MLRGLLLAGLLGGAALTASQVRAAAGPAAYYVATTGRDSAPCSQAAPCASLLRASSLARPGDAVLVLPGVYGPQTVTADGAPGAPIAVRALGAPGAVTLTRPLPLSPLSQRTALLRLVNSSYLTVSGFHVLGPKGQPGFDPAAQPGGGEVEVENHQLPQDPGAGLVLRALSVEHADNTCLKVQDNEPAVQILDNTLRDCGRPGETQDHGIYDSGPAGLIQGNAVAGATGYGIHVYGGDVAGARVLSNTVSGAYYAAILAGQGPATIAANTLYDNGSGIAAAPGVTVADNVVANNNGPAVSFLRVGTAVGNVAVVNNTLYHNGASPSQPALSDSEGYGGNVTLPITVENNIIVGIAGSTIASLFNTPISSASLVGHNLYRYVRPSFGKTNYDQGHSLNDVDPQFVNAARTPLPDLRLRPDSPAIRAGVSHAPQAHTLAVAASPPDLGALCYSCAHPSLAGMARHAPALKQAAKQAARRSPGFSIPVSLSVTMPALVLVGAGLLLILIAAGSRLRRD